MKKNKILCFLTVAFATVSLFFVSCEDEVSQIGNSISSSEVTINVDSLTYNLLTRTVEIPSLDSKSSFTLIGSINVPDYGNLNCSYVTEFLPAESLSIPDSITGADIDSVKLILSIPKGYITGDSLAPQQIKVYSLIKQLPSDISSSFDPEGYYDSSDPLAVKSFTLSGINYNDTAFIGSNYANLNIDLPVSMGRKIVDAYRNDPEIFTWPQNFAKYWPGIFVNPTFGKGCIAAIQSSNIFAYFPQTVASSVTNSDGSTSITYKQIADSVCLFTTGPEVLSSVNITYNPSKNITDMIAEGKSIITTPGGYTTALSFPAKEILKEYWKEEYDLGVINNMIFSIPAKLVTNSYGIGIPPALLMVKTSEMENFFTEGRLPDNVTSFYSIFSPEGNAYTFSSMRQYIVDLKNKGEENITEEDLDFTLVPVNVSTESYTDNTGTPVTVVTSITPYIIMPSMVELDTENAVIVFTYSNETLY